MSSGNILLCAVSLYSVVLRIEVQTQRQMVRVELLVVSLVRSGGVGIRGLALGSRNLRHKLSAATAKPCVIATHIGHEEQCNNFNITSLRGVHVQQYYIMI